MTYLFIQHDRLTVEHLAETTGPGAVKTSDIARLMELFQSALLHYWEFEPKTSDSSTSSDETKVDHSAAKGKGPERKDSTSGESERSAEKAPHSTEGSHKPAKRVPVIFFDEAHKLLVISSFTPRVFGELILIGLHSYIRQTR